MFSVSLLASILFLGGWHGPITIASLLDVDGQYFGNLLGCLNVLFKGVVGVSVMMWVRWTLPRLRIDQVMATCLKYCTPIAAVMFAAAALWQLALPQRNFFGLTSAPAASYNVNEGWSVGAAAQPAETRTPVVESTPPEPATHVAAVHPESRRGG
jgi:NADH-quinone oxidoreductase subunit H